MEASIPLLFAAVVGFTYAFEADHLVAAGVLGLPIPKRVLDNRVLQITLVLASSLICLGYGSFF